MKFVDLQSLFLIWAVPALFLFCFYGMRKRKRILTRFARAEGLMAICPEASAMRRWFKCVLLLSAVLFSAIALAGPQYGFKWQEIEQKGVDIILAVDCSRSMLAGDIKPSRLARAKREILDLLSIIKGDRVGLVAFAGTAFLQCPLTLDYSGFHIFLDVLSPDFLPVGGTDLNRAIGAALEAFEKKGKTEKAIVLITDGESTAGDPMEGAMAASKAGVKLFCIGVGNPDGVPVPEEGGGFKKDAKGGIVLSKLDENMLKQTALATGGAYVRSVAGDMDLDLIYEQEIRRKMQTETISAGKKKIWQNRFQWALALALSALSIELLVSSVEPKKTFPSTTAFLVAMAFFSPGIANAGVFDGVYEMMEDGLEAYQSGDFEKARNLFLDAENETESSVPEILYNIGLANYKLEKFDEAANYFARALQTESIYLRFKSHYNLGNSYFRQKKYEKALESYRNALAIDKYENDEDAIFNRDLAERKLEEQQKQQQSDSSQDGEKQDRRQDGQKQSSEERRHQEQQHQAESGSDNASPRSPKTQNESGESSEKQQQEKSGSVPGQNESAVADKDSGEEQDEQAAAPPEKAGRPRAKKTHPREDERKRVQAETMLNRLEDRPGRALMPAYGETGVEKDW